MSAQALDRTRATPLWEQLLTDLRRRLDHDEFAVAFPGELALVAEYGVSRHTVREAVRRLREEGPGHRRAGAHAAAGRADCRSSSRSGRSTACSRPSRRRDGCSAASCARSTSAPTASWPRGWGWRSRRRSCTWSGCGWPTPSRWPSTACGCPSGSRRRCSTSTSAAPRSTPSTPTRCGVRVTGGSEVIRAVVPDAAQRELLGIGPGVAALAIDRLGLRGGRARRVAADAGAGRPVQRDGPVLARPTATGSAAPDARIESRRHGNGDSPSRK